MNRRNFIGKSALLAALAATGQNAFPVSFEAMAKRRKIGIQLFSVRDELGKDFMGTLQKLSDIGFYAVEAYGFDGNKFFDKTMKELSRIVKDMGMSFSGSHMGTGVLPENTNDPAWDVWKKCATEIKSGGGSWAIQAWFPGAKTLDELKKLAAHYNRVGEVCKKNGVKFASHNHNAEFVRVDGQIILDYLLEHTDPSLVYFQLDMGHALEGGADCVQYVKKYTGRFPCWHASDYNIRQKAVVELGKGNVDYPALFDMAKSSGLKVLTLEQEMSGPIFDLCRADYNYLEQFEWTK